VINCSTLYSSLKIGQNAITNRPNYFCLFFSVPLQKFKDFNIIRVSKTVLPYRPRL
jgi:hypothetical protein